MEHSLSAMDPPTPTEPAEPAGRRPLIRVVAARPRISFRNRRRRAGVPPPPQDLPPEPLSGWPGLLIGVVSLALLIAVLATPGTFRLATEDAVRRANDRAAVAEARAVRLERQLSTLPLRRGPAGPPGPPGPAGAGDPQQLAALAARVARLEGAARVANLATIQRQVAALCAAVRPAAC
jgi:hypothetical protein